MFRRMLMSLLFCSSMSFSGAFDFYLNSNRAYWDVITEIPEMKGLYGNSPDGMVYILSEASGNDYCWLKNVDSNGVSDVRKFYVDWTNGKYTPETYGRYWNELCKNSKRRKKFVDTDALVNSRLWNIERFVRNYSSGMTKIVKLKNSWNFEWYVIREDEYDRDIIGYNGYMIFKLRQDFNKGDSLVVYVMNRKTQTEKVSVHRKEVCPFLPKLFVYVDQDEVETQRRWKLEYKNASDFLKILRRDSVIDINCE